MTLRFLTAGESHGTGLIAILDGIPAGLPLKEDIINQDLARRQRGIGAGPRMKIEEDTAKLLSGIMAGGTIGSPIAILIENKDHSKWKGKPVPPFTIPRPGHADLTGTIKFGYSDLRPALERASARETAARVAVGAICKHLLRTFGILVGGYVIAIGEIDARIEQIPLEERFPLAEENEVRCPDRTAAERMSQKIHQVIKNRDTLGGIIEIAALNLPAGLGSYMQWDRRLESRLGAAILSVQAVKGVEIGPAFENTRLPGTQVHDPIRLGEDRQKIYRPTNRSGGIEGGISTGEPLLVRAAMKPIATTLTPQPSVDLLNGEEVQTKYERSDFCPVPRAVPVLEAMVSFILADALMDKLGGDSLQENKTRFEILRKAQLSDLRMAGIDQMFWGE
jgi:chorismate synthase